MSQYVAVTPKEGRWPCTLSASPGAAMEKLRLLIMRRRALVHPIDNEISAEAATRGDYKRLYAASSGSTQENE